MKDRTKIENERSEKRKERVKLDTRRLQINKTQTGSDLKKKRKIRRIFFCQKNFIHFFILF